MKFALLALFYGDMIFQSAISNNVLPKPECLCEGFLHIFWSTTWNNLIVYVSSNYTGMEVHTNLKLKWSVE